MINNFFDALPEESVFNSKNIDLKIRSVNAHLAIDQILSQTVLDGGKRLRPLLTYLMAYLFKIDTETVTPYARASELVHAASLSHDDVIDNATLRRGKPSINILATNKKAVLAGDYLLSSVLVDLCNAGNLEIVREMSLVIKDLSEGEWLQLDLAQEKNYSRELIREVALKKTSSIMSFCTIVSPILNNSDKKVIELARSFGRSLGLAFQLIDDTLDYSAHSDKDKKLDLKNNMVNSVIFEILNSHPLLFSRFRNGEELEKLLEFISFDEAVEKVSAEAQMHLKNAGDSLWELECLLGNSSLYAKNPQELKKRIEALHLIISFIGLRKI